MMTVGIRPLLREVIKLKWIFVGIVLYLFGVRGKERLHYFSLQLEAELNAWDLLFYVLSNIYLNIYLILPIFIFHSLFIIVHSFHYSSLIRFGSYKRWIYYSLSDFLKVVFSLLIVTVIVGIILTFKMPYSLEWSAFSQLNTSYSESQTVEKYVGYPVLGIGLQMALFVMFMASMHLFFCSIYIKVKRTDLLVVLAVLFWVYSLFSFRFMSGDYALFSTSNYMLLHWGVVSYDRVLPLIGIVTLIYTILILGINQIDRKLTFDKKVIPYLLFACGIGLLLFFEAENNPGILFFEQLMYYFVGATQEGFSLKNFLYYLIIHFSFLFFVQQRLYEELSYIAPYKILRYGSAIRWFKQFALKVMRYALLFLLLLFGIALIVSLLAGKQPISFQLLVNENLIPIGIILYHFFINGFLQLILYALLVIIITLCTKELFYSTVGFVLLMIFMFPGMNLFLMIPSGLNSMGYLLVGESPYLISFLLINWIAIGSTVVVYLMKRKDLII